MSDVDTQIADLEAEMDEVRAERDAANDDFRRRLLTLRGRAKVLQAEVALANAHAEVDAQTIGLDTASTSQEG